MNVELLKSCFYEHPESPISGAIISTGKIVGFIGASCLLMIQIGMLPKLEPSLLIGFSFICFSLLLFSAFLIRNFRASNPEIPFKYTHDGVLWHGKEINIALRIDTFNELLGSFANNISGDDATLIENIFKDIGINMGKKFGNALSSDIYKKDINKGANFFNLQEFDRLKNWVKYDSATGWGLISFHDFKPNESFFIIAEHPALFKDKWFTYIMSGYIEAVVSVILSREYLVHSKSRMSDSTIRFCLKLK